MQNKVNYYLIASIARSFDESQSKNFMPHLIMSVFYSQFDVSISNLEHRNVKSFMVIRILDSLDEVCTKNTLTENNRDIVEYNFSLGYLITLEGIKEFKFFIQSIIGSHISQSKKAAREPSLGNPYLSIPIDKYILKNKLINVLFNFENLQWFNVKHLFNLINVRVSGGSITRRHFLSTTEFNLISSLLSLGLKHKDIYQNILYINNHKDMISHLKSEGSKDYYGSYRWLTLTLLNELDDSIKEIFLLKAFLDREIFNLNTQKSKIEVEIKNLELSAAAANPNNERYKGILGENVKSLNNIINKINVFESNKSVLNSLFESMKKDFSLVEQCSLSFDTVYSLYMYIFNRRQTLKKVSQNNLYFYINKLIDLQPKGLDL